MLSPELMINEAGATHRPDTPPPRPRGQHIYENMGERADGRKSVSGIQRIPVEMGNIGKKKKKNGSLTLIQHSNGPRHRSDTHYTQKWEALSQTGKL